MRGKQIAGAVLFVSSVAWAAVFGIVNIGVCSPAIGERAPEFTGIAEWINSKPIQPADWKGKVMVVHFWTHGCVNCIHNYPHYQAWQEKSKSEKNLLIVGVHTPEFDAEKDVARIREAAARNRLRFAIAVDNDSATWRAWRNRYWPCIYLVDRSGKVRHRSEGELDAAGFKSVTEQIDILLAE